MFAAATKLFHFWGEGVAQAGEEAPPEYLLDSLDFQDSSDDELEEDCSVEDLETILEEDCIVSETSSNVEQNCEKQKLYQRYSRTYLRHLISPRSRKSRILTNLHLHPTPRFTRTSHLS